MKTAGFTKETFINAHRDNALFLAIDQGGHASRVVVFDTDGEQQAIAVRPVSVQQPQPCWVEQDADEIECSLREALADIAGQLGERCRHIRAAGLVTQRSNIVCWDRESGAPLSPAISWQDRRALQWMQPFDKQRTKIRAITGLLPNAHYGASKIHWCLEQLAEVQFAREKGTLACGPLASFLLFRLLKETPFVVDAVNASRTLLWDCRQRCWSAELLSLFGLTDGYLPQGVTNRYAFGQLEIGDMSIPLTVCSGDQSAALFANGKPEAGAAYLNMGTGAFLQCVMPHSTNSKESSAQQNLLHSMAWDDGDESVQVLEATVNGAGSALLAVANELRLPLEEIESQYAHWLDSTKKIPLYLNGISGLGSPFWRPQFGSQFVGPHANTAQPSEKIVAVLESIVFLLCLNLQAMSDSGVSLQRIIISGGLSVLDGLCQRLADVSQLRVERAAQTEATSKGLACLLAKPAKAWLNDAEPDCFAPQKNSVLIERYQCWHRALQDAVVKDKMNDVKKSAT